MNFKTFVFYLNTNRLIQRVSAIHKIPLFSPSPAPADIKRPRLSCPSETSESVIVAETPPPKRGDREYELNSIAEE